MGADRVFFSDDEKVKGMATEGGRARMRVGRDSVVWYSTNQMLITKCQSVSNKLSPFLIIFYNWLFVFVVVQGLLFWPQTHRRWRLYCILPGPIGPDSFCLSVTKWPLRGLISVTIVWPMAHFSYWQTQTIN